MASVLNAGWEKDGEEMDESEWYWQQPTKADPALE